MSNAWMAGEIPGTSAWDLLRIILVLALIIGLIIVVLRFIGKRNRGWWMNRSLRSLGGLSVGPNKSLQIVEWNGRIYVLGVGENVTLLEAITDPELVADLLARHEADNAAPEAALPAWLRQWGKRRQAGASDASGDADLPAPSFEETLEHRLREISQRRQKVEQLLEDSGSGNRTDQT